MITQYLESCHRYYEIPEHSRLFSFGCWNRHRRKTARIVKDLSNGDYDFGVVIGDNIYGRNGRLYLADIDEGFAILSQAPAKVFMGLGNHDVDSRSILARELAVAHQLGLEMTANWYQLGAGAMVVDTNFYFTRNQIYGSDSRRMLTHLRRALREYKGTRPFIVFGHYPPAFYRSTAGRSWVIYNQRMDELTQVLLDYGRPIIYISADTHNYQHLSMSNIEIFIAGTGGGDLDHLHSAPKDSYDVTINGVSTQVIVRDCYVGHGYLDISITPSKASVLFRPST